VGSSDAPYHIHFVQNFKNILEGVSKLKEDVKEVVSKKEGESEEEKEEGSEESTEEE